MEAAARCHALRMSELQESCHTKVQSLRQQHAQQLASAQKQAAAAMAAAAAPAAAAAVQGELVVSSTQSLEVRAKNALPKHSIFCPS